MSGFEQINPFQKRRLIGQGFSDEKEDNTVELTASSRDRSQTDRLLDDAFAETDTLDWDEDDDLLDDLADILDPNVENVLDSRAIEKMQDFQTFRSAGIGGIMGDSSGSGGEKKRRRRDTRVIDPKKKLVEFIHLCYNLLRKLPECFLRNTCIFLIFVFVFP